MGTIRKNIGWHPELSQLIILLSLVEMPFLFSKAANSWAGFVDPFHDERYSTFEAGIPMDDERILRTSASRSSKNFLKNSSKNSFHSSVYFFVIFWFFSNFSRQTCLFLSQIKLMECFSTQFLPLISISNHCIAQNMNENIRKILL